jgi:phosphoenolpyruvate carboxykinase (GTP)
VDDEAEAVETPIGRLPTAASLDVAGLGLSDHQLELLLTVDRSVWKEEASLIPAAYEKFGARLPQALWDEHEALIARLETRPTPSLDNVLTLRTSSAQ